MQSIGSARFTWRSERGKEISGDLRDAARAASSGASKGKGSEQDQDDDAPPRVETAVEVNASMNSPAGSTSVPTPAPIDQMPAMLWVIDGDLRFTSCRGGALADLGLAPDSLAGMTLYEFFQTDDAGFTPIAAALRALRGETVNYELDWNSRVYRVRIAPSRNGSGQIAGAVAVVFDISDVRREEEQLLTEDEFLRRVAENMPDAVAVVDGEGHFLYASPSCEEQLGYEFEQLARINFLSLIEPDDLAIAQDAIVDVYRGDSYPFAVRMRKADGEWAVMESVGAAVTTKEGTRLLLVSMRDISDEKRSEEYVHHNRRMAELRQKAQETAETLRQLLIAIERGETLTPAEAERAQALSTVEPPMLGQETA